MARKRLLLGRIGIYCIKNIKNNRRYIGSSLNLGLRKKVHFQKLRKNISNHKPLQEDYNKFGKENFIFEVIEYCEKEKLIEREQVWMDFYKSWDSEFGYNVSVTAGKITHTEEEKKKRSEKLKGNSYALGNKCSDMNKKRLSELHKGKTHALGFKNSEETKQKHRERMTGNTICKGKKLSEEHKNKIRESMKRHFLTRG